jgi:hypothetical protein
MFLAISIAAITSPSIMTGTVVLIVEISFPSLFKYVCFKFFVTVWEYKAFKRVLVSLFSPLKTSLKGFLITSRESIFSKAAMASL